MKELPSDLHRLLDAERGPVPSAPPGARERVLSRVRSTLGPTAAAAAGSPGPPPSALAPPPPAPPGIAVAVTAAALPGAARWHSALLLGVTASAVVYLVARAVAPVPGAPLPQAAVAPAPIAVASPARPVGSPAVVPVPVPVSDAESGALLAASPVALAAPARDRGPRRQRLHVGPAAPVEGDLEAERAILDLARAALQRRETVKALAIARQHERRFPEGQLTEERESLMIRVLVSARQREAAEARAATFRQRFPRSIFLPAVDAVLQ